MRIVVDSNIVFSAILNPDNKLGLILTTANDYFEFSSVYLLKTELDEHSNKLLRLTTYTSEELVEIAELITRKIHFISSSLIPVNTLLEAENILSDIDPDDTEFLALAIHLNAKLWTGDKHLIRGLKRKGFEHIPITTDEIFQLFTDFDN